MIPLISLLVFLAVSLFCVYLFTPKHAVLRRRILEHPAEDYSSARDDDLREGPIKRLILPTVHNIGASLTKLLPQELVASVEKLLIRANDPMSLGNFLFFWASMACLPLAIILMIVRLNPEIGALRLLVLGGFMLSFGVLTPYWLLRRRARNQMRKIRRALPDALDLLLTAVEAGLGVDAAFALVAERFRGPVGDVFAEYLKQVGLGRSRRAALEDVADRSGVEELIKLAASVAQANEVGTTIGDVLRLQAYELRDHRKRKAQEAAQRAPVWMVIPLALCFMPAMAAVVVVPSILHLLDFVGGLGQ